MRTIALISMLIGSSIAGDIRLTPGGGNYVRVQNGKIVEYAFADSLEQPQMRSDGSTNDDNVFNGQISISDALNPNSPFSQWVDDLLNPESDPYKQAVINALKILLAILISALAPLGITNFTVLILGFAPGSVEVNYEMAIDPVVVSNNNIAAADIGTAVSDEITNNGDQITTADGEVFTMNNGATPVNGGDGTTITSSCPTCWTVIDGACVPDPSKLTLSCNADGMSVAVDHCVMGETDISALSLSDSSCNAGSNSIIDTGSQYIASTSLDGCSTEMTFGQDNIQFVNYIKGDFDSGSSLISSYDRYSISLTCTYATQYDDISGSTDVTASLGTGGPNDGTGQLSFTLKTFTDGTFSSEDTSGTVRVGTTLYFGIEISQSINDATFSVTDCTVKNSDQSLDYNILTNKCPNNRVGFQVFNGNDGQLNTFSYTVFEFKDDPASTLHLACNIVVCSEQDASSTCATGCSRRRKRRELTAGVEHYRIAKDFEIDVTTEKR